MNSLLHADGISMELPILSFNGPQVDILYYDVFVMNSFNANPNEMPHNGISSGSSLFAKVPTCNDI